MNYRGTTLLRAVLTESTFQAQTSLSDVTVASVVPTKSSTHCSQNELQEKPRHCLAPTGNSLERFFALLFLLKRI